MSIPAATVILEDNVRQRKPLATVWLLPKPWDLAYEDIEGDEDDNRWLDKIPGMIHCIGPIEPLIAEQVAGSIVKLLESLGISVESQSFPDD